MMTKRFAAAVVAGATGLATQSALAQVWGEIPDATQFAPGQVTVGAGPLIDIVGDLAGGGDVDMYCIEIFAPTVFGAWTEPTYPPGTLGPAGAAFDSQLWLFDPAGLPIMHSDDTTVPSVMSGMGFGQPNPLIGPPPPPFPPGRYMLAISQYDIDALDPAGGEIWADVPFAGWSGPDGTGGPLAGWTGGGFPGGAGGGSYHIVLAGASYCIPEPSTLSLLGLGGLTAIRRRRW